MSEKFAGLTRKEFIALPMEERHRRLAEQAKQFVKEHGYLRDDPCDGHSTMIPTKSEAVKEVTCGEFAEVMPIVNPHNEDTAERDEEKIRQRQADAQIILEHILRPMWYKNKKGVVVFFTDDEITELEGICQKK